MSKNIKHLIVDTSAFIKAGNLQDLAENVYTIQEVIDEITNDRQRKKLVVLPYDLIVKDVFTENIKFVSDFAKKTGDYGSLSATDIKVMALTYQMEKEKIGTDHLKTEPTMQKTVKVTGISKNSVNPDASTETTASTEPNPVENDMSDESKSEEASEETPKQVELEIKDADIKQLIIDRLKDAPNLDQLIINQLKDPQNIDQLIINQLKRLDLKDEDINNMMSKISDDEEGESENEEFSDDSDNGEWITPGNLAEKKKEMEMGDFEVKSVEIACITSDFAMQNVLKQIGLNVTSIDGRVIKQLRTFIFRCTTCFKTTSVMTKLFCPKCGHATLRKVAVSVDEEGNQHIHINARKLLSAKGKKFSLPTPRGGQHFQYPILTEDQHIHKRFATKLARNRNNPLDPEYTAGFSPFVMRDVNSKSAVLGIRANKQDLKYHMKHFTKGKK